MRYDKAAHCTRGTHQERLGLFIFGLIFCVLPSTALLISFISKSSSGEKIDTWGWIWVSIWFVLGYLFTAPCKWEWLSFDHAKRRVSYRKICPALPCLNARVSHSHHLTSAHFSPHLTKIECGFDELAGVKSERTHSSKRG